MANLKRTDLFHALFDAFRSNTDAALYVGGGNPYRFLVNGTSLTAFVGNVHTAARGEPDEYRIQCPGNLPSTLNRAKMERGDNVFVLGYYSELDVFTAWNPVRFLERSTRTRRFSIYTRLSTVQQAHRRGFSRYVDADRQNILAFRSDLIGTYIENAAIFHRASMRALRNVAETYVPTRLQEQPGTRITVAKRRVTVTSTRLARSPQFRAAVLGAYDFKCAMCGIQLELVEAAHIVPHAHQKGFDEVENGVALCVLHHRSFDTGLLFIKEDCGIGVNAVRVGYLGKVGRGGGLSILRRGLRSSLTLPSDTRLHPTKENISLGNQLRGVSIS